MKTYCVQYAGVRYAEYPFCHLDSQPAVHYRRKKIFAVVEAVTMPFRTRNIFGAVVQKAGDKNLAFVQIGFSRYFQTCKHHVVGMLESVAILQCAQLCYHRFKIAVKPFFFYISVDRLRQIGGIVKTEIAVYPDKR